MGCAGKNNCALPINFLGFHGRLDPLYAPVADETPGALHQTIDLLMKLGRVRVMSVCAMLVLGSAAVTHQPAIDAGG